MNLDFGVVWPASGKGHLLTGGATAIRAQTRASSTATDHAMYEPNENPAAHNCRPGKRFAMKSSADPKSSFSPWPSSHSPALLPTPRKFKRSTAHPIRTRPLVPWKHAFVCIVPPAVGNGCAKTTAARGGPSGRSSNASSGPRAPGISRTTSANTSPRCDRARNLVHEGHDELCESGWPGNQPEMPGARQRRSAGVRPQVKIFVRDVDWHHTIELRVAGDHQYRRVDALQLPLEVERVEHAHSSGHLPRREHVGCDVDAVPDRRRDAS